MSAARAVPAFVAAVLAVGLGVLALGSAVLLSTPMGAAWAIAAVDALVPARIAVGGIDGSIARGLRLHGVVYEDASVFASLETVALAAQWRALIDGRLVVERLSVEQGLVRLEQNAEPRQAGRPELPSLSERLAVRDISLAGVTVEGLGTPVLVERIEGAIDGPHVALDALRVRAAGADLSASGAIALDGGLRGSVEAALELPAGEGGDGGDGGAGEPQRVLLTGTFGLSTAQAPWSAHLQWSDLRWEGSGAGAVTSTRGRVVVEPDAAPMRIAVDAELRAQALPDAVGVEAQATLDGGLLVVNDALVTMLGGRIRADGTLDVGSRSGNARFDYADIDPAILDPRLYGTLGGEAELTFASEPALGGTVAASVTGALGGRPLAGRLDASYADETLTVEEGVVSLDEGRVEVEGVLGFDTASLRFAADVPRLGNWYPPASGALTASGRITGDADDPTIAVAVDASDLALEDSALPRLDRLTVGIDGTRARHRIGIEAQSEIGRLTLETRQSVSDGVVRGAVEASTLALERGGTWALAAPARFAAGADVVELERACFTGPEQGRLCATLEASALAVQARALPGSLAEPWLPEEIALTGAADADVALDFGGALRGRFEVVIPALAVASTEESEAVRDGRATAAPSAAASAAAEPLDLARLVDVELRGTVDERRFSATLGASLAATGDGIDGRLELAPPESDGALTASLHATLADVSVLDALLEDVEGLGGGVDVRFSADGSLAAPQVAGSVELRALQGRLPALGIAVSDGSFTAAAGGADAVDLRGRLCSGGCMELGGTLALPRPERAWSLEARVRGDGFALAALPDLRATVSPDLAIAAGPARWDVTGALSIDEGLVLVEGVPRSAVRPASATIVHGRPLPPEQEQSALPASVVLDIDAELGDVRFEGLGLVAELEGTLDVEQTSDGRLRVLGTTTIEQGSFRAYGQELTIESGQLIFTGPPDNPSLDIRATREVDTGIVGLAITGTARDPRSVIFSDPPVSESEALALLVTGRSLSSAGPADAAALERAALGLGLRRALPALSRIGENLGLDELGVDAPGDAEGAIVAGKQLGEDVYLRYKYGLFDDFAGLELIYRITERFRLRTETGTSQSIDLIYEVDRGEPAGLDEQVGESIADGNEAATPSDVAAPAAPAAPN